MTLVVPWAEIGSVRVSPLPGTSLQVEPPSVLYFRLHKRERQGRRWRAPKGGP